MRFALFLTHSNQVLFTPNLNVLSTELLNSDNHYLVQWVQNLTNTEKNRLHCERITYLFDLSLCCCSSVVLLSGQQKVSKFNQSNEDVVFIYMALYRYTQFQADVLVIVNNPDGEDGYVIKQNNSLSCYK
ncbi:unnamed protein product [Schistosoma mattheei]|uniref:Uncharacterized protein n=1 Tax=Schistosoma mattheei TaxID=31246 RepID=A0A183Q491_9TREM|nr:unnamed protein product [Schistosoma mattheei]